MCEIPAANCCSIRKMFKFDREITKAKMLQCMIMNCSHPLKNNILIKISVLHMLMLGIWWPCN